MVDPYTDPYYEDSSYFDELEFRENWVSRDEVPDLDSMKRTMEVVFESIYETGDIEALEANLEFLAHDLDMHLPKNKNPLVQPKRSNV